MHPQWGARETGFDSLHRVLGRQNGSRDQGVD